MKNFKKLNTMKAEKGKGVETAKKHKKYVKDKLETAKGYIQEMTGISSKKDLLEATLATNPVTAPVTAGVRAIKSILDKNKKSKDDDTGLDKNKKSKVTKNFKLAPRTKSYPVPLLDFSEPSDRIIRSKRKDDDTGKAPPKFFNGGSILVKTKLGRTKPTKIY
jgi:hypothetical protein